MKVAEVSTVDGHTSLSLRKDVLYAGEIKFVDGKVQSWSNGSGHYQPPEKLHSTNIPAEFKGILKDDLFTSQFIRYKVPNEISTRELQVAPKVDAKTEKAKQLFDQHVIVNTDANNPAAGKAVDNLVAKHPDKSVVVTANADGSVTPIQGELKPGTAKFEVVGHGDGKSLGGLDGKQISDVVQKLAKDNNTSIDKLNLVACGSACTKDGKSLVNDVSNHLLASGNDTVVKGYETPIKVDGEGHKKPTEASDGEALGKGDRRLANPDLIVVGTALGQSTPDNVVKSELPSETSLHASKTLKEESLQPVSSEPLEIVGKAITLASKDKTSASDDMQVKKLEGARQNDSLLGLESDKGFKSNERSESTLKEYSEDRRISETAGEVIKQQVGGFIEKARQEGEISSERAIDLDVIRKKAGELLSSGPVFLGEQHDLPDSALLIRQLIDDGKINRILFEHPDSAKWRDRDAVEGLNQDLKSYGYSSLDEYLSKFKKADTGKKIYTDAQFSALNSFGDLNSLDMVRLYGDVILSGINADFVDVGRNTDDQGHSEWQRGLYEKVKRGEIVDHAEVNRRVEAFADLEARQSAMANKIKDGVYNESGVLGLFGAEHLKSRLLDDGSLSLALQDSLGVTQERVFEIASIFVNKITGEKYYSSEGVSEKISSKSPFNVNETENGQTVYSRPEFDQFFVFNGAGEKVKDAVSKVQDKKPSVTTVFEVSKDGDLEYVSGRPSTIAGPNKTKVYVFSDPLKVDIDTSSLLTYANKMMSAFDFKYDVEEFFVSPNGEISPSREKLKFE